MNTALIINNLELIAKEMKATGNEGWCHVVMVAVDDIKSLQKELDEANSCIAALVHDAGTSTIEINTKE
jgi:hypothetical protein